MANQPTYKIIDLFGNEELRFITARHNKQKNISDDYNGFVDKFEEKKTTDDCYTPEEVFKSIVNYVSENCDIKGLKIIRPFFPGGDYESIDYDNQSVVIDNPPFSIVSQIARFYIKRKIKFFLFAPHITLFSPDINCTAIVCGADIVYENGAIVKTSFLSNLFDDLRILGDPKLYTSLMNIIDAKKANLPKYKYPENVLTVSQVQKIIECGIRLCVLKNDVVHCRGLDSQKAHKKTLFGSGFLLSEKAAAEKAAAEKAAAEKAAAEKNKIIEWPLSDREIKIIESLKG
jgi:hypothetical protein